MNIMSRLPLPEQDQDIAFSFWVDGKSEAGHGVAAFAVEEAIFSLTRVEILLVSAVGGIDAQGMLGRKATLTVQNRQAAFPRYFSGIVVEAVSSFEDAGSVVTRVLLLPELCRLENGSRYRIFQGLSAPDIVQTIFCEHKIADAAWQLTRAYSARPFCMQYGESDLDFVQRILVQEGIFYYFVHRNEGCHQLVLCDRMQALLDCPGQARLDYDVQNSGRDNDICCSALVRSYHMGAGASHRADLCGNSNSPHLVSGHAVTLNRHPDEAVNDRWHLASVRHEGFHLGSRFSAYGAGNCFFLKRQPRLDMFGSSFLPATLKSPGLLEKLAHYEDGRHDGYGDIGYVCAFSALHCSSQYTMPEREGPLVSGPHAARVIAVDTADERRPRCKVSFAMARGSYGRAENGVTCWVDFASALGDALLSAMPAPGENVIVDFLQGDPDQPIIIARGTGGGQPAMAVCVQEDGDHGAQTQPLRFMAAEPVKSAVYHKTMPAEGLAAQKPVIPIAQVQAALLDESKNTRADTSAQEWVGVSRVIDVGRHQRENIEGVYELNCGEKYLCKTGRMNVDASQKLTIRGPGGKVIIDTSCITFEAPVIRLRGRLVVEEEAFDRHEGIKSAIRDELPLVAGCAPDAHANNGKGG